MSHSQPRQMHHFLLLTDADKIATIKRMAANGWTLQGIAAATKLSVEYLRTVIGEPK